MERLLDVHVELDPVALGRQRDPVQTIAEVSRRAAEDRCAETGVTLRHPDPREVVTRTAIDPLSGRDVLLVATRWVTDSAA